MNKIENKRIKFSERFIIGKASEVLFEFERLQAGIKPDILVIVDVKANTIQCLGDVNKKSFVIEWEKRDEEKRDKESLPKRA